MSTPDIHFHSATQDSSSDDDDDGYVDLEKEAEYNVILGPSLQANDSDTDERKPSQLSVRYNHKPAQGDTPWVTKIKPSKADADSYELTLKDPENAKKTYTYNGRRSEDQYITLEYDPATKSFILDQLDAEIDFNLTSTPRQKDAAQLADDFPQLGGGVPLATPDEVPETIEAEIEEELFREDGESAPNPDNPYDFRHWMSGGKYADRSDSDSGVEEAERQLAEQRETELQKAAPTIRAAPRKENAKPRPKPRAKAKLPAKPQPKPKAKAKAKAKSKAKVFKSAERTQDSADDESSADGGLTIEMDPDTKPKRGGLGARLEPGSGAPISLRSAASSVSPVSMRRHSSSASDEDADGDVDDDVQLPLPAMHRPTQEIDIPSVRIQAEEDDQDDGLEAELAQAMGSEDVRMSEAPRESESESEEE
ncbi:MAG: hypothetical protein M1832_005451 [Thelocarpon impressellum]|nr:MAG: hypothetical protein M1832_005451 [Thelocarpon impressellum]